MDWTRERERVEAHKMDSRKMERSRKTAGRTQKANRLYMALGVVILLAPSRSASPSEPAGAVTPNEPSLAPEADSVPDSWPPSGESGPSSQAQIEKRAFAEELLKALHEHYGGRSSGDGAMEERRSAGDVPASMMMPRLLQALGGEGDMRRLIDWVRSSFNPASIPEVATQFVVSKLASVNCPALLNPDKEESLVPRFLLFNEHHVDVPFELTINPSANDCLAKARFDPTRKTIVLIHGYLGGYTLIDGLTNIKNRLLDLNRSASEKAIETFTRTSQWNSSYVFTEDLNMKIRSQLYNVIIIDWFNGANPRPRANYIQASVNAQVVGKLIARFLSALVTQCGTPAGHLQIIAHSLGCHVSGFTGKAMNAAGHRLGKIIHLDPVGLCFGRLFSEPRYRLSAGDALDTQAIHVSLNIFDNPLDGAHANFLVNGGRDQPGCGNQNEVTNSTTSSVALLFDPAARFSPCSHLRALALFEDDHSSEQGECQFVGYRCQSYERFLAGKCAFCDATNAQCRLMGLAPLSMHFRKMILPAPRSHHYDSAQASEQEHHSAFKWNELQSADVPSQAGRPRMRAARAMGNLTTSRPLAALRQPTGPPRPSQASSTRMFGQPGYFVGDNELGRRSDRRLVAEKRDRITQVIGRLRGDTRSAWTSLRGTEPPQPDPSSAMDGEDSDEPAQGLDDNQLAPDEALPAGDAAGGESNAPESAATGLPDAQTTTPNPTPESLKRPKHQHQQPIDEPARSTTRPPTAAGSGAPAPASAPADASSARFHEDLVDQVPLGGQAIPAGSLNGPLYFLGTSSMTSFCVNYYQVRILIAESRLQRVISQNGVASNRLKPQHHLEAGGAIRAIAGLSQRAASSRGRDMLHLTVKLTDSMGHFFKGFSVLESARSLARVMNDFIAPPPPAASQDGRPAVIGMNEPMVEITILLNSTRPQATKISETIISYYFHPIVLADRVEVNYMSNISPE